MTREDAGDPSGRIGHAEPWWQWLIGGVGAVLVVGTASYLGYKGITSSEAPPAITLRINGIETVNPGYVVVVEAVNAGGQTAADLKIKGVLLNKGLAVEESEFTIDYLPPRSSRHGGLFFTQDPQAPDADLELEPSGYRRP